MYETKRRATSHKVSRESRVDIYIPTLPNTHVGILLSQSKNLIQKVHLEEKFFNNLVVSHSEVRSKRNACFKVCMCVCVTRNVCMCKISVD